VRLQTAIFYAMVSMLEENLKILRSLHDCTNFTATTLVTCDIYTIELTILIFLSYYINPPSKIIGIKYYIA
jgi:hypothetical protein